MTQMFQDKKQSSGEVLTVSNPAEWVDRWHGGAMEYLEPTVIGTIIAPSVYLSGILELCHAKVIVTGILLNIIVILVTERRAEISEQH